MTLLHYYEMRGLNLFRSSLHIPAKRFNPDSRDQSGVEVYGQFSQFPDDCEET
jgi:hypothetical protein